MKKYITLLILVFCLLNTPAWADKPIDVSLTYSIGYDQITWDSGFVPAPTGSKKETVWPRTLSGQIKYNRWKYQPTLEISIKESKVDFSDYQAYQVARPQEFSIGLGLTYLTDDGFGFYGIPRFTHYSPRLQMAELENGYIHSHTDGQYTSGISTNMFSMKFGAYKMWNIGVLKTGLEISAELYPFQAPGFDRCREMEHRSAVGNVGIRIEY